MQAEIRTQPPRWSVVLVNGLKRRVIALATSGFYVEPLGNENPAYREYVLNDGPWVLA